MNDKKEYYIHILNWPVSGDSPEDAAREAARALRSDPSGFFLCVTENEIHEEGERFDSYDFDSAEDSECSES